MNKICIRLLSVVIKPGFQNAYNSSNVVARNFSFRSDLSLETLYPKSKLALFTPTAPLSTGDKFSGYIPINELDITYSRSSGPGGQHVNCVNTKVDLRFKLASATWIPEKTKQKLLVELKNKLSKDGYFVIKSDLTRSQQMNLADALEKLRNIIRKYEIDTPRPTDETLEKIRRRKERAARERLFIKRQRSQTKQDRQGPNVDF
ncbi:peptidyl-tRNA hydrolase ICT1, mitochondrial [Episyrphus balteatus]|uniref:peptidyl-tRNA hydrolase ICT1, mitochondrial n=1 Tax=Episyrphus balteatus TaxID=286459 RepID=UPI00248657DE|nr:peptidyl-tRNA hydrolase ICT1, mitochondrial [Episyrphus balteatus]